MSERQWGTVREDYSDSGNAWDYFTHDQARSRAYRWGEDGLAGICDERQRLCFALSMWNGKDRLCVTPSKGTRGPFADQREDTNTMAPGIASAIERRMRLVGPGANLIVERRDSKSDLVFEKLVQAPPRNLSFRRQGRPLPL